MGRESSQLLAAHLLMVLTQLLFGSNYVITRAVLTSGAMNPVILSLYRDILALCCLVPVAYKLDRGNRLKFTRSVALQLLLLGFVGIYGSNYLFYVAVKFTSAEVAAAFQPFLPVLTALIAALARTEVVYWNRRDGRARMLGIVCSCIGALVVTFYMGPTVIEKSLHSFASRGFILGSSTSDGAEIQRLEIAGWQSPGWQIGSICAIGSSLALAIFINVQAPLVERHSAAFSVVAYAFGFGTIFMAVTALISVPDFSEWAIGWNGNLLVVAYNGIVVSALNFAIIGWCLARVGAVVVASYLPLQTLVAALLAFFCLGTRIYLGSVVGAAFFLTGVFLVSWVKEESARLAATSRLIDGQEAPYHNALLDPLIQVGRP